MFIYLEGGILQGATKKNKYDTSRDDQHHLLKYSLRDPYKRPAGCQRISG